jgi:hypothetical protein
MLSASLSAIMTSAKFPHENPFFSGPQDFLQELEFRHSPSIASLQEGMGCDAPVRPLSAATIPLLADRISRREYAVVYRASFSD